MPPCRCVAEDAAPTVARARACWSGSGGRLCETQKLVRLGSARERVKLTQCWQLSAFPWPGVRTSRYPGHSGRRPPSLSAALRCAHPALSSSSLCRSPQRMRPSLLFSVSFLSPCFFLYLLGSFEVTVTSVSLPPFVSRRGLSNTNQRLSQRQSAVPSRAHPCLSLSP